VAGVAADWELNDDEKKRQNAVSSAIYCVRFEEREKNWFLFLISVS